MVQSRFSVLPKSVSMPESVIPPEVSNGTSDFTIADLHNLVRKADLPEKESAEAELLHWASCLELQAAIKKPEDDVPLYEFERKGGLYSKGALNLFFYKKAGAKVPNGIDRRHLCHIAGSIQRIFEQPVDESYNALVGIVYGEEVNPINQSITSQRHYEQVSFNDILEQRLSNLSGTVENLRCTGVVKAKTAIRYTSSASQRPHGLYIPIVFGVFAGRDRDENWEPLGDRVARMLHQCSEARSFTASRNILSVLNKPKLINEYKADRRQFPQIRKIQELTRKIDEVKADVKAQVEEMEKIAAVCALLETALCTVTDADMEEYCETHFLLSGINRRVAEQFVALAHKTLDEHGQNIFLRCRSSLQELLPFKIAEIVRKCVDGMFASDRWRYVSRRRLEGGRVCLGIQLVAADGSEEIELVQFKRTSLRALLGSLGFVLKNGDDGERELQTLDKSVSLTSLGNIGWSSSLTPGQQKLYELACDMCFKTSYPPFPSDPSISPDFAKGALIFVSPPYTRDLPSMVVECEQRGHRIGFGTMLCSKSLSKLVMTVLDTKRICGANGETILTTSRHTAFSKVESRVVLELPSTPSLSSRKAEVEELKQSTAPNHLSDNGRNASLSGFDIESLETRPTRSTGDMPRDTSARSSKCDRPHRQKLRGHVSGGTFYEKREMAFSTKSSSKDREDPSRASWHSSWDGTTNSWSSSNWGKQRWDNYDSAQRSSWRWQRDWWDRNDDTGNASSGT